MTIKSTAGKVTVTPDRTISGSYDWCAIGPRCDRSAIFATISSSGPIRRSISTPCRAITNDWRISMARTILGNCATSGSNQRPMYDQLLRPTIDRTINCDGRRPMVRSIVASCDRSFEQSWHPMTEHTINRGTRRPIVRSIVGCNDRPHGQS